MFCGPVDVGLQRPNSCMLTGNRVHRDVALGQRYCSFCFAWWWMKMVVGLVAQCSWIINNLSELCSLSGSKWRSDGNPWVSGRDDGAPKMNLVT